MHIGTLWLILTGEVILVLVLALGALLISRALQRRRDRKAAMYLVGVIKENEAQRQEQTSEVLNKRFGLSGNDLKQAIHTVMHAEKLLYQRIINMYIKRDVICLRELNIDVEAVTEPFRTLEDLTDTAASPDPGGSSADAQNGDEDALRAENLALKQELQITMETMSRMLGEYASMFGGETQGSLQAPVMNQILDETEVSNGLAEAQDNVETGASTGEDLFAMGGDLDGLEELQGFDEDETLQGNGDTGLATDHDQPDQVLDTDATVVATPPMGGEIDLADEDLDDIFASAEPKPEKAPMLDENGEPIDGELADLWADAFNEQENEESGNK